jgi:hypothetical protein
MKLSSKDFEEGGNIPSEHTCDGKNVSPQLSWEDVPEETKSFALSVRDPDAPGGTFLHWLICNIPKHIRNIERASVPKESVQVTNDFGKRDYGGPCPPSGTHRYCFTLYALDTERFENITRYNFFTRIEEHTIEKAELMGRYRRR